MKIVDVVEIEKLIPIFKNGETANAIEVAMIRNSDGDSIQYHIIVGKNLYNIGDKAIYIQPDYTIPFNKLFLSYHAPQGDPKKSRLGKQGRVRAVKFNFNFADSSDPIYSNGVLVPWDAFLEWYAEQLTTSETADELPTFGSEEFYEQLQPILGVDKYVSKGGLDGSQPSGLTKGDFPSFMYTTDEGTIQNNRKYVDLCHEDEEVLSFTLKRDGSSFTMYNRINPIGNVAEKGICSRKQEKKLEQEYIESYKDGEIILHPYYSLELKEKGWFNDETRTFYTEEEATQFEPTMGEVRDAWVDTNIKYGYLQSLVDYCDLYSLQLSMRGELIGAGNKGSGNKFNSDAKSESHVVWFGVDDLSEGFSKRIHYGSEYNLKNVCDTLDFDYTEELFEGVFTYDQIIDLCDAYFKLMKEEQGIVVEGIVVRTKYSNRLSCKYINPLYDSKS